jgi:hypothetical protein
MRDNVADVEVDLDSIADVEGISSGKMLLRFDSCTTPIQQLHNNPLHEGGPQYVGPTLM